jgi:hypothetical protein
LPEAILVSLLSADGGEPVLSAAQLPGDHVLDIGVERSVRAKNELAQRCRLRPPPSAMDLRQGVEHADWTHGPYGLPVMPHLTTRVAATVPSQLVLYSSRACR